MEKVIDSNSEEQTDGLTNLIRKYNFYQQGYRAMCKIATIKDQYLELIHDLAVDYDGANDVESLKALIDEIRRFAHMGMETDRESVIYESGNKKYNILHEEIKVKSE